VLLVLHGASALRAFWQLPLRTAEEARRRQWCRGGVPAHPKNEVAAAQALEMCGKNWPCLVTKKFYKFFQIFYHIESLNICMKH
jgi:hypothetical protein